MVWGCEPVRCVDHSMWVVKPGSFRVGDDKCCWHFVSGAIFPTPGRSWTLGTRDAWAGLFSAGPVGACTYQYRIFRPIWDGYFRPKLYCSRSFWERTSRMRISVETLDALVRPGAKMASVKRPSRCPRTRTLHDPKRVETKAGERTNLPRRRSSITWRVSYLLSRSN